MEVQARGAFKKIDVVSDSTHRLPELADARCEATTPRVSIDFAIRDTR